MSLDKPSPLQSFFAAEHLVHQDAKDAELAAFLKEVARQQSNWDLKSAAREKREAEHLRLRDRTISEIQNYLGEVGLGKVAATNPERTFFGAVEEAPSGLFGVTTYELEAPLPDFPMPPRIHEEFTIFHGDSQAPVINRSYADTGMPSAEQFIEIADVNKMAAQAVQSVNLTRFTAAGSHAPREKLGSWEQVSENVIQIITFHQQGGALEQS